MLQNENLTSKSSNSPIFLAREVWERNVIGSSEYYYAEVKVETRHRAHPKNYCRYIVPEDFPAVTVVKKD